LASEKIFKVRYFQIYSSGILFRRWHSICRNWNWCQVSLSCRVVYLAFLKSIRQQLVCNWLQSLSMEEHLL